MHYKNEINNRKKDSRKKDSREIKKLNILSMIIKRRIKLLAVFFLMGIIIYMIRVMQVSVFMGDKLKDLAFIQHTRSRTLKAERGIIYDRNGIVLADNKNVYTIFTINSQIKDKPYVAKELSTVLELKYEDVLKMLSKNVALYKIKSKVPYDMMARLREKNLKGVEIDEDYKRIYPYGSLLSHTLGFCGGDNQGIIALEAKYDKFLKGEDGKITAYTDAKGKKLNDYGELRTEAQSGDSLVLTIDKYIQEKAEVILEEGIRNANAKRGCIIVMNPSNGEIYALCNKPDFNLNAPFEINNYDLKSMWNFFSENEKNNYLNNMWRNFSVNDTYEPGSIFKIFTTICGLETGKINENTAFYCPGFKIVEDRRIKCWRYPKGHGSLNLKGALSNSCNPYFMEVARRVGVSDFYDYCNKLKLTTKTGIDVPGEAKGIFLPKEKVGPVEISVMGFGQSFQITPIELIRMASVGINGGYDITPHFGKDIYTEEGTFTYPLFDNSNIENEKNRVISNKTSMFLRQALFGVVESGGASAGAVKGYKVGGKTATSEKLPRRKGKYIGGYLSFAPADNPKVIALCLIDEPQGQYYGSIVALPNIQKLFEEILPYLGIEKRDDLK